jgi:hypothetical protein
MGKVVTVGFFHTSRRHFLEWHRASVTILDPKVATQSGRIEGKSNCVLLTMV